MKDDKGQARQEHEDTQKANQATKYNLRQGTSSHGEITSKDNPVKSHKKKKEIKYKRPLTRFEGLSIWFGIVGILVAAITGGAIVWQDRISARAVNLTQKQMEISLSPVIQFGYELGGTGLNFWVQNWGQSVATNIKVNVTLTRKALPTERDEGSVVYTYRFPDLPAGIPNPTSRNHNFAIPGYDDATLAAINRTEQTVTIQGTFAYTNPFQRNPVKEPFCASFISYQAKNQSGGNIGKNEFVPCDEFPIWLHRAYQTKEKQHE